MATLTPSLTLTSTDYGSDSLSFTVTDSLSVTAPSVGVSRASILHTGVTTLIASSISAINYVYLKNIDSSNYIDVRTDAATGFIRLSAGEIAFFPLMASTGLEVQANTATCVLEYAYFTKS